MIGLEGDKMIWQYADKFGTLPSGQAEIVEALVEIAEQLEKLNKQIESGKLKINVSGGINTHSY